MSNIQAEALIITNIKNSNINEDLNEPIIIIDRRHIIVPFFSLLNTTNQQIHAFYASLSKGNNRSTDACMRLSLILLLVNWKVSFPLLHSTAHWPPSPYCWRTLYRFTVSQSCRMISVFAIAGKLCYSLHIWNIWLAYDHLSITNKC